jgi:hypothetical protein
MNNYFRYRGRRTVQVPRWRAVATPEAKADSAPARMRGHCGEHCGQGRAAGVA